MWHYDILSESEFDLEFESESEHITTAEALIGA